MVEFLTKFHTDRSEDEQNNDEKAYLIKQIKELYKTNNKTKKTRKINFGDNRYEQFKDRTPLGLYTSKNHERRKSIKI